MAADVAARIFEPFYTTKDVGKGSGLGLSQVYGFVTQSGGKISVDTAPGRGAAFTLCLPRSPDDAQPRPVDAPAEVAPASERLLVVEDDPDVLTLCVDLLESLGYRCDTAVNATEALERLNSGEHYDLLFSDVVMPGGMTGIQLARRAVAAFPDMRILLTSGYVGENALQEAHEFDVIDKPYEQAGLARRLRLMLDGEVLDNRMSAAS
jgi:CheY-like chemotaxis protein